jgi:hypothetical protein
MWHVIYGFRLAGYSLTPKKFAQPQRCATAISKTICRNFTQRLTDGTTIWSVKEHVCNYTYSSNYQPVFSGTSVFATYSAVSTHEWQAFCNWLLISYMQHSYTSKPTLVLQIIKFRVFHKPRRSLLSTFIQPRFLAFHVRSKHSNQHPNFQLFDHATLSTKQEKMQTKIFFWLTNYPNNATICCIQAVWRPLLLTLTLT